MSKSDIDYKKKQKLATAPNRIINCQTDMGTYFMWDTFFTHLQDLGRKIKEDKKKEDKKLKCREGSGTTQKNTAASKGELIVWITTSDYISNCKTAIVNLYF